MRPIAFLAAALVLAAAPACAATVKPRGMAVPLDEVRMVDFGKPVATVYVGNPAIADVTMIDGHRAFVLGKGYGATNIIALDKRGMEVANEHVSVFGGGGATVTLNRGGEQVTYACAGSHCEPAPVPGDSQDAFNTAMQQMKQHQGMGAATGGTQAQ